MIISCSRRTDIPAFYGEWFMDKIEKGYCISVNPFNKNQRTNLSLKCEDVDLLVFWTKNPAPFLKNVEKLIDMGYKFYFQYTLNDYPKFIEPNVPDVKNRVDSLIELSSIIGKDKIIWRYDPVIFADNMDYIYHEERFAFLLEALYPFIERIIISIYDNYSSTDKRLEKHNIKLYRDFSDTVEFKDMLHNLVRCSMEKGLKIYSCAELLNLESLGISPGKCIDDEYIKRVFDIKLPNKKDRNQRKECGCIESRDIGAYNTCPHKCIYCYANKTDAGVDRNFDFHTYNSMTLI